MSRDADPRRRLPSVDRLLDDGRAREWIERFGREPVVEAVRAALEEARGLLAASGAEEAPPPARLLDWARRALEGSERASLRPLVNGTGVVLHTNLGRAPLSEAALEAVRRVAKGYSNLEYDLGRGERESRLEHCTGLLTELTGAGAALVTNNNAAAVALVVNELARGREVVISRGELVEIGGSFRLPEVVERSGARLREVGTTNRTRLEDYRRALGPESGLLLKVHPSNYRVQGFSGRVPLEELSALGREAGVPVAYDLGSGLLRPDLYPGFPPEPFAAGALEAGAGVATMSADKLLAGPQAGIVLGAQPLVQRMRDNPLLRAFRVDKMTLAALEATLRAHRDTERAARDLPAVRALRWTVEELERRARSARQGLDLPEGVRLEVAEMVSAVGGGSYPGFTLPSAGWRLSGVEPRRVERACRRADPPLVGRIEAGAFLVDFRTVLPGQETTAAAVLSEAAREAAAD